MPLPSEQSPCPVSMSMVAFLSALGSLLGCGADGLAQEVEHGGPAGTARTLVYECPGGAEFVVRVAGDTARVFTPSGPLELTRARSGSGEKFERGESLYWSKGEEAMLDIAGESYRGCRNNRRRAVWEDAKLRGVDFRAVGNEPGWMLEISAGTGIRYVGDYGRVDLELESQPPVVDASKRETRYTAVSRGHRLVVLMSAGDCADTMSGERFPVRVTLTLDGRTLRGCGRELH